MSQPSNLYEREILMQYIGWSRITGSSVAVVTYITYFSFKGYGEQVWVCHKQDMFFPWVILVPGYVACQLVGSLCNNFTNITKVTM